ncbi:MAG: hypothetical protein IPN97_11625 [Saprospiraceae bacterium]|nr:hypothetical protein [Saprospiraceae bacterium]
MSNLFAILVNSAKKSKIDFICKTYFLDLGYVCNTKTIHNENDTTDLP